MDAQLAEVIVKGGQALGLSTTMSAYPDLEPATVGALVEMIREFAE